MKKFRLFRRRYLTTAAIVFMVSSALISFLIVQENDRSIADLKRGEEQLDQSIRALWQNASDADRNADTAVIVSLLAKDGTPDVAQVKTYYLTRSGIAQPGGSLMDVLKNAEASRRRAVDTINDDYLKRISLESDIATRESSGKRISELAFLLQLMSLVLVILIGEMRGHN